MSQDQDKSMDKKEIAEEEREKMLNAENTKHTGAAPASDLEAEEQKPKKKIPIGGIKMPGFCRTKSKEPCKVRYAYILSRSRISRDMTFYLWTRRTVMQLDILSQLETVGQIDVDLMSI